MVLVVLVAGEGEVGAQEVERQQPRPLHDVEVEAAAEEAARTVARALVLAPEDAQVAAVGEGEVRQQPPRNRK